jgi:hypothetical protein
MLNTVVHIVTQEDYDVVTKGITLVSAALRDPRYYNQHKFFQEKMDEALTVSGRMISFLADSTAEIAFCRDQVSKSVTKGMRNIINPIYNYPYKFPPEKVTHGLEIEDATLYQWLSEACPKWAKIEYNVVTNDINSFQPGNLIRMLSVAGMHKCVDFLLTNSLVESVFKGDNTGHSQTPLFIAVLYNRSTVVSTFLVHYRHEMKKIMGSNDSNSILKWLNHFKNSVLNAGCEIEGNDPNKVVHLFDVAKRNPLIDMLIADEVKWIDTELMKITPAAVTIIVDDDDINSESPSSVSSVSKMSISELMGTYQNMIKKK